MKIELDEFRKLSGIIYPPFSMSPFEKYFYDFIQKSNNKEIIEKYIPVFWTEIQISCNGYDRNKLQNIMDNWDKDSKYFTIVQHDDGINVKLNNLIWLNYKTVKTFYKRSFENLDEPFPRIHPN